MEDTNIVRWHETNAFRRRHGKPSKSGRVVKPAPREVTPAVEVETNVLDMSKARRSARLPYSKAELDAAWEKQYGHLKDMP
jgi:hypothetical protein